MRVAERIVLKSGGVCGIIEDTRDMRILHTSDWHLGKMLLDTRRTEEFDKFSAWLLGVIKEKGVDVLLVSGDIFDTTTPSATAKKQYCDFLAQASEAGCRQVVITAGNHDSMAHRAVVGAVPMSCTRSLIGTPDVLPAEAFLWKYCYIGMPVFVNPR